MPDIAIEIRRMMRDCCAEIEMLHEWDCTEDLLKYKTNDDIT
jgi:hypothetical protein